MPFVTESWHEMAARHERERLALLDEVMAQRVSVSEAARILCMDAGDLTALLEARGIFWPWGTDAEPQGRG